MGKKSLKMQDESPLMLLLKPLNMCKHTDLKLGFYFCTSTIFSYIPQIFKTAILPFWKVKLGLHIPETFWNKAFGIENKIFRTKFRKQNFLNEIFRKMIFETEFPNVFQNMFFEWVFQWVFSTFSLFFFPCSVLLLFFFLFCSSDDGDYDGRNSSNRGNAV